MKRLVFACILNIGFAVMISINGQAVQSDSDPKLLAGTKFTIPQSAIDADIDGKVRVGILVDEKGSPKRAAMTLGPAWPCGTTPLKAIGDLENAIVEMAMGLDFTPAIKNGKPASATVALTLDLKNPNLASPQQIDPATGKPVAKMVTGGVINGRALVLERPAYPAEAKANRIGGAVSIQILVSEDGKILRAGAVSGAPMLQFAARDAACRSKFKPTLLAGNPVKVSGVVTYNFVP